MDARRPGVRGSWPPCRSRSPRPARRPRRAGASLGSRPASRPARRGSPRSGPPRAPLRLAQAVDRRQARLADPRELAARARGSPRRRGAAAPSARRGRTGSRHRRASAPRPPPCTLPGLSAATFCPASDQRPRGSLACIERRERRRDDDLDARLRIAEDLAERSRENAPASARVLCIFQLATKRFIGVAFQRFDARKGSLREELEGRAAAGRNVGEFVGDAGLVDRGDALAAAHDRDGVGLGEDHREGLRARGRRGDVSKTPIGPFQKIVSGRLEQTLELLDRLRPDVEGHRVVRDLRDADGARAFASSTDFATTKSEGSAIVFPSVLQRSRISRATATLSSSSSERPTGRPRARTKWFAMPPPTSRTSARRARARNASILPEIFAPPRIAANGRSGSSSRDSSRTSFSSRRPAPFSARGAPARRRPRRGRGAPRRRRRPRRPRRGGEALRELGSLDSSPAWKRRFSRSRTSPAPGSPPPPAPRARRTPRRTGPDARELLANAHRDGRQGQLGLRTSLSVCPGETRRSPAPPRLAASRMVGSVSSIRVRSVTRPRRAGR